MKIFKNLLFVLIALMILSCEKKEEISDLDKVRNTTNATSYPVAKMDSAQAINAITKQKVQEVMDLSILYLSGSRNTDIDSTIHTQLLKYFVTPDTLKLKPLFKELESLRVKTVKVQNLEIKKKNSEKDTLNQAVVKVEYFDNKKSSIGVYERNVQYILKPFPEKFKKEFKFYFLNFYTPQKDSISEGVIR
ncbi:hypothetical protein J5295_06135 [Riemerella anatipestifer]|uniref:Lipoprotein n=1 Tax=Riemerella anatipestifer (strain ATCC 11845 / DSM 15868 / JCM 9532 / NCTC 11014) TaxID=693978 RepID=E4TC71_RIEAD|nr:hypothetical protein [Riemerella anatipestifer]ADQ82118.1 hypothetical protein Riean_0957 [Riemerella anatipestifer ATCC 11845 = DSM 15868]AFD56120.1 hypothetical protein RA0C_1219 [Riemerella anatipestifer ATCC 11845 = DSM 15868]AGC39965.1 hypothetical protein G148_0661 [Riemerella anatipestifer RA-CH-2]AKP71225.1 hypothetical protein CG09_1018 [Riemerella anatipestifer]AKQ40153.1 hypothetical protein AS87_07465 [Riemerella anatipestifer Yb2]